MRKERAKANTVYFVKPIRLLLRITCCLPPTRCLPEGFKSVRGFIGLVPDLDFALAGEKPHQNSSFKFYRFIALECEM